MVGASAGIDDVNGLVAAFEAVSDERKRHTVLVVTALEERADVTRVAEFRAGKRDGRHRARHGESSRAVLTFPGAAAPHPKAGIRPPSDGCSGRGPPFERASGCFYH